MPVFCASEAVCVSVSAGLFDVLLHLNSITVITVNNHCLSSFVVFFFFTTVSVYVCSHFWVCMCLCVSARARSCLCV